jgi:transcriptional regulator with XRE-family HTH domain
LGPYLRTLRKAAALTVRQVQEECVRRGWGVTNGYVSHLELGKVKYPNPNILRTLADCYGADYLELMRRAGYPVPAPSDGGCDHVVFAGAEHLSEDERADVQDIITLKLRRRRAS